MFNREGYVYLFKAKFSKLVYESLIEFELSMSHWLFQPPTSFANYRAGGTGVAQQVEWDLNKTSKTLTETITALFLMA